MFTLFWGNGRNVEHFNSFILSCFIYYHCCFLRFYFVLVLQRYIYTVDFIRFIHILQLYLYLLSSCILNLLSGKILTLPELHPNFFYCAVPSAFAFCCCVKSIYLALILERYAHWELFLPPHCSVSSMSSGFRGCQQEVSCYSHSLERLSPFLFLHALCIYVDVFFLAVFRILPLWSF